MTHSGSCLCGNVQFEIDGTFDGFFLCHCKYCQKDTGSAHAANLFSADGELRWLSGANSVTNFRLPTTRHVRSFCSLCGSALPSAPIQGEPLLVPAGSLDSEVPTMPQCHLFLASKANWDNQLEKVPGFDSFPDP